MQASVISELQQIVDRQGREIDTLKRELAKAKKDSSNSSKPPSSDIVKPKGKGKRGKGKRKRGAQPGHEMHDPPEFPASEVDRTVTHTLDCCPGCGGEVESSDNDPKVQQKVELKEERPWTVTQHEGLAYFCPHCQEVHWAPIPEQVKRGGMLGPRMLALAGYMKSAMHASYTTSETFFRDVLGLKISRGRLAKAVKQVSGTLEPVYEELSAALAEQEALNVDETGHKDNGDRFWTWVFRSRWFTVFRISRSRGSVVLVDVLGEDFEGIIGCDCFSAYKKFMRDLGVPLQLCLAHLIRDLRYLEGLKDEATAAYGHRLVEHVRKLFRLIHEGQDADPEELAAALERQADRIVRSAAYAVPDTSDARRIAKRFREHGRSYFRFITTPGIDPTNNLAEQAIRFVVIDRRITQGTRSETGQRWCERIWTVLATCAQQGRSAFDTIAQAVTAWVDGQSPPSLLPAPAAV